MMLREMARLHEDRARSMLATGRTEGWPDFFAAITVWARAGDRSEALRLIAEGRRLAAKLPVGMENVEAELENLAAFALDLTGE